MTSASRTIPASGGSVQIENEDGVALRVSLPSGAVLEPTRVTLRALDAPPGIPARFRIEPSGLRLLQPASFTVTIPAGMAFQDDLGFAFHGSHTVLIPADADAGARTLTASLRQFGFADPVAPAAFVAVSDEPFIDVDRMSCQLVRDALTDQILRAQAWSGLFPPDLATPLIEEYRAALLVCESADSVAQATEALRTMACANLSSAETNSQAAIVATAQELKQNVGFLVAAEGLAQEVGAGCHVQSATMDGEFNEFLDAYIARINDPGFVRSFPTWDALWQEIRTCIDVQSLAAEFGVDAAQAKIINELFPALFARLHEVALDACANDDNNSFLLDILTGGHTLDHPVFPSPELPYFSALSQTELVEELHRCGSSVTVQSKDTNGGVLGTATIRLVDGSGPVDAPADGSVVITSDILGFTCNGILQRPPIRARAEVPGVLPTVNLGNLAGSLNVGITATLDALPEASPGVNYDHFDIVLERDRSVCGVEAAGSIELCRVRVSVTAGTPVLCVPGNNQCHYFAWIDITTPDGRETIKSGTFLAVKDSGVFGRWYFYIAASQRGFWVEMTGTLTGNELAGVTVTVDYCPDPVGAGTVPITTVNAGGEMVPHFELDLGSVDCPDFAVIHGMVIEKDPATCDPCP